MISEELLPPCVICKKQWKRKETTKYVYHASRGVVCKHHPGVQEWFEELVDQANEYLREMGCHWNDTGELAADTSFAAVNCSNIERERDGNE